MPEAGSINSLSSYVQEYGSVIDERDSHVCEKDLAIAPRVYMDEVKQGPTVLPFATAI